MLLTMGFWSVEAFGGGVVDDGVRIYDSSSPPFPAPLVIVLSLVRWTLSCHRLVSSSPPLYSYPPLCPSLSARPSAVIVPSVRLPLSALPRPLVPLPSSSARLFFSARVILSACVLLSLSARSACLLASPTPPLVIRLSLPRLFRSASYRGVVGWYEEKVEREVTACHTFQYYASHVIPYYMAIIWPWDRSPKIFGIFKKYHEKICKYSSNKDIEHYLTII